jgi:hypothetical protein
VIKKPARLPLLLHNAINSIHSFISSIQNMEGVWNWRAPAENDLYIWGRGRICRRQGKEGQGTAMTEGQIALKSTTCIYFNHNDHGGKGDDDDGERLIGLMVPFPLYERVKVRACSAGWDRKTGEFCLS